MSKVPPADTFIPLKVSRRTPRRKPGIHGRRPIFYPDLNWADLAKDLGCSRTYLSRVMNGVKRPSIGLAEKIADLMGWTLNEVNQLYKSRHSNQKAGNSNGKSRDGSHPEPRPRSPGTKRKSK